MKLCLEEKMLSVFLILRKPVCRNVPGSCSIHHTDCDPGSPEDCEAEQKSMHWPDTAVEILYLVGSENEPSNGVSIQVGEVWQTPDPHVLQL